MSTIQKSSKVDEGGVSRIPSIAQADEPACARCGKVWLVGAGPGAADLLTVRAVRLIGSAEVVAYDELVSEAILALVPDGVERIAVGRRAHGCRYHDQEIHPSVLERAREGRRVVRLKGGDPLVFGRGGEEAQALAAAGIAFEVVPGISAALGAAAALGLPLTLRACASSVTFATAHCSSEPAMSELDGDGEAPPSSMGELEGGCKAPPSSMERASAPPCLTGTLVYYMGLGRIDATCAALIASGRSSDTPAAVVSRATLPDERTVIGTLANIALRVRAAGLDAPALLFVGDVVARRVPPSSCMRVTGQ